MKCHGLVIKAGWLDDEDNELQNKDQYLDDAFQLMIFDNEMAQASSNQRHKISKKMEDISKMSVQKSKSGQSQALTPDRIKYILSYEELQQEFSLFKKGEKFGGISQRPCKALATGFGQIKSKGSNDFVEKDQKDPKQIFIQTVQDASKEHPWEKVMGSACRLFFVYGKRSPVWVYMKDQNMAQRWWNYFKCSKSIESQDWGVGALQSTMETFGLENRLAIISHFCYMIDDYAKEVSIKRKESARLSEEDLTFLSTSGSAPIKRLIALWFVKSNTLRQKEMDLIRQREEEERARKQEEEKNKRIEENTKKHYALLNIKQIKSLDQEKVQRFVERWQKKSIQFYTLDQVKQLHYVLTFRSIHIDENIEMVKPVLEVTLQSKQMREIQLQNRKNKTTPDYFFKLKMFGKLQVKSRDQYYRWDLQENQFENYSGIEKLTVTDKRESCSIRIVNLNPDDIITLSMVDGVAVFEESKSEFQTISVVDFFEIIHQGRSVWLPLMLTSKHKTTNQERKTVSFVEVDLIPLPSTLVKDPVSYEDELEAIIQNDYAIIDPIYQGTVKIPIITYNIIHALMKVLEENYPQLQSGLKMVAYMMLVSTHESDRKLMRQNYFEIKKLMFRKIIENVCHLMGNLKAQLDQWDLVIVQLMVYGKQIKTEIVDPFKLLEMKLEVGLDDKTSNELKQAAILGFPAHLRAAIWWAMMGGQTCFKEIVAIMKIAFKIDTNQQREHDQDGLTEYMWLFNKISEESSQISPHIQKQVQDYITNEKRHSTNTSEHEKSLNKILLAFLFVESQPKGSVSGQPTQFTSNFLPYLFLVADKVFSMNKYHYVKFRPKQELCFNKQVFGNSDLTSFQMSEIQTQSDSFYLLFGLYQTILVHYPFAQGTSHQGLLDDCSYLNCYLIKVEKNLFDHMQIYNVCPENIWSEAFLTLFSELFPSEILYRLWDLILFECKKVPPGERPYIVPGIAAALINRIKSKAQFIFTQYDYIQAIRFEAALISDVGRFIKDIQEFTYKVQAASNQVMDEDGALPSNQEIYNKTYKEKTIRFFDMEPKDIVKHQHHHYLSMQQYLEIEDAIQN